jgi:hypothetical protein
MSLERRPSLGPLLSSSRPNSRELVGFGGVHCLSAHRSGGQVALFGELTQPLRLLGPPYQGKWWLLGTSLLLMACAGGRWSLGRHAWRSYGVHPRAILLRLGDGTSRPYSTSTLSLLGLFLRNQHIAEASASLLMLFTCNKGLTNPEYLRVLNKT